MKKIKTSQIKWFVFMITLLIYSTASAGPLGVGRLMVSSDDQALVAVPDSVAILYEEDGVTIRETLPLNGKHNVMFNTLLESDRPHLVAMIVPEGYLPANHPTDPDAVNDLMSCYGRPKLVEIWDGGPIPTVFRSEAIIEVNAAARDVWTMERLADATLCFTINGGLGDGVEITQYPWSATTYGTEWITDSNGVPPEMQLMLLEDSDSFTLTVSKEGYQDYVATNILTGHVAGDEVNLGELFMVPVDSAPDNQVGDQWEEEFFVNYPVSFGAEMEGGSAPLYIPVDANGDGDLCDPEDDADGDGVDNRSEYIAGTDPRSPWNVLALSSTTEEEGSLTLSWPVEKDRTYRVTGTTDLFSEDWIQLAGSWEATNGQSQMSWANTNLSLAWNGFYRVEVMPCTWQGTNQVLVSSR